MVLLPIVQLALRQLCKREYCYPYFIFILVYVKKIKIRQSALRTIAVVIVVNEISGNFASKKLANG
jgi:hypothetical protein